ncbi:hypothetical protein KUCAC02_035081 [Chaenocephalus aceratus]|nr:hypothetical protein KUCAC02_035081 [Chaenocephalus aceratus]
MDKQNIINDILQMSDGGAGALQPHRSIGMNPNFTGVRPVQPGRGLPVRSWDGQYRTDGPRGSTSQHASAAGGLGGVLSLSAPSRSIRSRSAGGPSGRMGPNGAPLRPNSLPGPRQMLQGPMMPNAQSDMDIGMTAFVNQASSLVAESPYPGPTDLLQHLGPGTAGARCYAGARGPPGGPAVGRGRPRLCGGGPRGRGGPHVSLYTALKDFDGLEEIDRALGIRLWVEQNQSLEQDQFQQDSMLMDQKPPMYSQQFAAPPSHLSQRGGYPLQDQGFHPLGGPMGPRPG